MLLYKYNNTCEGGNIMEIKMRRVSPHMDNRLAQMIHGCERERRFPKKDEAILEEVRFAVTDNYRQMHWR